MIEVVVTFGPEHRVSVTGETAHDVLAQLTAVEQSEIPLAVGRIIKGLAPREALGRVLGAELIGTEEKSTESAPAPQKAAQRQQPEAVPSWAKVVPNAPLVNGQPAWLVNGGGSGGKPWTAFVHPSEHVDRSLPETSDPDDPRLAAGTAWFRRFIK